MTTQEQLELRLHALNLAVSVTAPDTIYLTVELANYFYNFLEKGEVMTKDDVKNIQNKLIFRDKISL